MQNYVQELSKSSYERGFKHGRSVSIFLFLIFGMVCFSFGRVYSYVDDINAIQAQVQQYKMQDTGASQ
jgi:hypothetical protein